MNKIGFRKKNVTGHLVVQNIRVFLIRDSTYVFLRKVRHLQKKVGN